MNQLCRPAGTDTISFVSSLENQSAEHARLVHLRKVTHSHQESSRLSIALAQACGTSVSEDALIERERFYLTQVGETGRKTRGVAQWSVRTQNLVAPEGACVNFDIIVEACWCDAALGHEMQTELLARMAHCISERCTQVMRDVREEYPEAVAAWCVECAPAALHIKELCKLEVCVALMNEMYGDEGALRLAA